MRLKNICARAKQYAENGGQSPIQYKSYGEEASTVQQSNAPSQPFIPRQVWQAIRPDVLPA
ncbi:MAG TPA: hypothetical protein VFF75_12745, partial [Methylophilaceae bacterium]|nr:hypothetical protein [Methylophilaceae bacterium]